MNIVIVEDNPIQKDLIEIYINDLGYQLSASFDNGEAALEQIEKLQPDLVLMDINLKGLKNGVDTAQEIHDNWGIPRIYTTAQTAFGVIEKAVKTAPLDILIKPITIEQLQASILLAVSKSIKISTDSSSKYIIKDGFFVYKDGHMFERIPLLELTYVEGSGNYFTLHFTSKKTTLKGTLGELENELPEKDFCRINRSTIVAFNAIRSFNNKRVVIQTGVEFNLSKSHADNVLAKLMGS